MKSIKFFLYALFVLFLVQPAYAWETDIKSKKSGWEAIYNSFGRSLEDEANSGDEHAALSDWALRAMGVQHYTYNNNPIMITDLNASFFRNTELRSLGSHPSAPGKTELEIRQLPAPPHFSGIPDFSYSVQDWINKNYYCPIPDSPMLGHSFEGWMGALNSNHFGSQASLSYRHLHKLALNLSNHARELREKLSKGKNSLEYYKEYVREAEREALSVEGYAQHFLQDRWSTGHMWERWNTSDYNALPEKGLLGNLVVSVFVGLLHGSEGFLGVPDALCSPQVTLAEVVANQVKKTKIAKALYWIFGVKQEEGESTKGGYFIPKWKHVHASQKQKASFPFGINGVGDNRFIDLIIDGKFGKEYTSIGKDYALDCGMQKTQMKQALMAGWVEVIRTFGRNPDGGFGIEGSEPRANIKGFDSLDFECDDIWVTNESMAVGWLVNIPLIGDAARIYLKNVAYGPMDLVSSDRKALVRITQRIKAFNVGRMKYETDLAQGWIGSYGKVKTGNHYVKLASYVEPENINQLPDNDDNGNDKKSWFGFFNRSHSDYWCEKDGVDILQTMRDSDDPATEKACAYLADRFYEGTRTDYTGDRTEVRTVSGKAGGEKVSSVCFLLGKPGKVIDPYPNYLHPGYVEEPYARNDDGVLISIINWCREIPVINFIKDDSGEKKKDWVQTFEEWDKKITISGLHMGQNGKITFACNSSRAVTLGPDQIESWNSRSIIFYPPENFKEDAEKGDSYNICIEREDGEKTVGKYLVVFTGKQEERKPVEISGTITSTDGSVISGAIVGVEIEDKKYSAQSGQDGTFEISIPGSIQVPNTLFVMADKENFNSATKTVNQKDFDKVDIKLTVASKYIVQIDKGVHHLGNGNFSGSVNSQFQKADAEGVAYSKEFQLGNAQLPPNIVAAKLVMNAKGVQADDPISINGKQVGKLTYSSQDGSDNMVEIHMDMCAFVSGNNTLAIHAGNSNSSGDVDDFEFTNIQLILTPLDDIDSVSDELLVKELSSIGFTGTDGKTLVNISEGLSFYITASGKSRCKGLKDMARVKVYTQGLENGNVKGVLLIETGLETGIFRSNQAISVNDVSAHAGQIIIAKSGFRGGKLKVVGSNTASVDPESKEPAGKAGQLEVLADRLKQATAASDKLNSLRQQWKMYSDLIDEQRAKGNDVSNLTRNLRQISTKLQQARKHLVELNKKYGTPGSLQKQIDVLKSTKKSVNHSVGSNNSKARTPKVSFGGLPESSGPGAGIKKADKPLKGGGDTAKPLPGNHSVGPAAENARPTAKQLATPVRWTVYKVKTLSWRTGQLPGLEVIKIAFKKSSTRAALLVKSYSVSLTQNADDIILWSVNWQNGDIDETRMAVKPDDILKLEQDAEQHKAGSVTEGELDSLIDNMLGPKSRKKE